MAVKSTNQITIIDVTDAYSVMLTSEAYTFVGSTSGAGSGLSCTTQAVAYCGNNQCSSVNVTAADIICPPGISATVSNSGSSAPTITFKTTATITTACEATIPVVVDGITVNKKFSFAVAKTGATGSTGRGISSTVIEYQGSTSNTTVPTGTWSKSIPSVPAGSYLWTRTTINYTSGDPSVSYSVAKQGATGTTGSQWYSGTGITGTSTTPTIFSNSGVSSARVNDMYLNTTTSYTYKCTVAGNASTAKWVYAGSIKGATGKTGATGATGATGNGISSAEIKYQASTSNTTAPTGTWSSSVPSVAEGSYLWTRTIFTYTNGDTDTQYSVAKQGAKGDAGADAITLTITASNGTVFKNSTGSTVLTAHVFKGAVEKSITDAGVVANGLGTIKWYKGEVTPSSTAVATAKTLTVSASEVSNTQQYTAQLE